MNREKLFGRWSSASPCGATGCAAARRTSSAAGAALHRSVNIPVLSQRACCRLRRLCCCATYLCAVGALVLLWLVYPQDYSYGAAVSTGLDFYPGQVGARPAAPPFQCHIYIRHMRTRWPCECFITPS